MQSGYQDLYWSTGDTGLQTDPDNNAQNTGNLFGSVIRISVPADGTGYTIPSGNLDSESCSPWSFMPPVIVSEHVHIIPSHAPRASTVAFAVTILTTALFACPLRE